MQKKTDVTKMKENLARLNERAKSAEEELKRLEEKRKKVQNLIAEEERKKRTHNLCSVGGLVCKYFEDDISSKKFKEMLDFLFDIDKVQDFVTKEREKMFSSTPNAHHSFSSSSFFLRHIQYDFKLLYAI